MPSPFFHLVEANNGGSNAAKGDRVVPMIMQYRSMEMGYAAIADVLNLGDVSPPPADRIVRQRGNVSVDLRQNVV